MWYFFDLDETLLYEERSVSAAFRATGEWLGLPGLEPAIRQAAESRWCEVPGYAWCQDIGCSYWEALSARFEGATGPVPILGALAESYRLGAWRDALAALGADPAQAADVSLRYKIERDDRHIPYPGAELVLKALGEHHNLAIMTNGLSCHQRDKLAYSELNGHFDFILASGDIGVGKPDLSYFREALRQARCLPEDACMIGDSPTSDIAGARAIGMPHIWLNHGGAPWPDHLPRPSAEVHDFSQLLDLLLNQQPT